MEVFQQAMKTHHVPFYHNLLFKENMNSEYWHGSLHFLRPVGTNMFLKSQHKSNLRAPLLSAKAWNYKQMAADFFNKAKYILKKKIKEDVGHLLFISGQPII